MKAVVVGDGGWGTALALLLRENGHAVTLWSPFPAYAEELRTRRENPLYLPGVPLPPDLPITSDPAEAAHGAGLAVLAVPSRYFAEVLARFHGLLAPDVLAVSVAKGFDPASGRRLSEIAEQLLGLPAVAVLSGPSHAEEVARRLPTAVVAACREPKPANLVQRLFMNRRLRVYTSDDPIGVEMGGALKNVIALAVGMCDGLGLGDNARAALITRGLAEIARLGAAAGAQPATFSGLSGLGDLVVTCTSRLSRNRNVGERLGRGEPLATILAGMKQVAEGLTTCPTTLALARRYGVETPVIREVHAILYEGRKPDEVQDLFMTRQAKSERH
jgi:glycerol-3-phosphate dehydrogenase (NAD(P)+)